MIDLNLTLKIPALQKVIEIVGGFVIPAQKSLSHHVARNHIKKSLELAKGYAEIDILKGALIQLYDTCSITPESAEIYKMIFTEDMEEKINQKINLKQIGIKSLDFLSDDIENKPIGEEFINSFKNKGKFISDKYLQNMWAKLLAGEIEQPGSFCLKTLQILENMSKTDAELFLKFCSRLIKIENSTYNDDELIPNRHTFVCTKPFSSNEEESILSREELYFLSDLGLIYTKMDISYSLETNKDGKIMELNYFNNTFKIDANNDKLIMLKGLVLTKYGEELVKIIDRKIDNEYLNELKYFFSNLE